MSIVILIPGILCIFALLRGNTRLVFLNFFIPVMVLFPLGYQLKLPHIPSLDFLTTVALPLGIAIIFSDISRWKFSRTDLWVALFLFTASYKDYRRGMTNDAIFAFCLNFTSAIVPYMAAKLLIEQPGIRVAAVKRFVSLLAFVSALSTVEFFLKVNLFRIFWRKFFPEQWWVLGTQIRHGFGRVVGPYTVAEHAGVVLMVGIVLAIWLRNQSYQEPGGRTMAIIPPAKLQFMILLMVTALVMTQSRGPWIGTGIALCVSLAIGKAKKPRRRAILLATLGILVGIPIYQAAKDYSSGPRVDYGSERETAQYRAQLIDNYVPIAKLGGPWGWGYYFPIISGQSSIDNEYLFIWVIQGYVGLLTLILLLLEAMASLIKLAAKARSKSDLHFILSILGIILGLAVTIATVYLDDQPRVLFFLLIGWSQAIRLSNVDALEKSREAYQRSAEPAFLRVYT
jgi:O-Antigen ligase